MIEEEEETIINKKPKQRPKEEQKTATKKAMDKIQEERELRLLEKKVYNIESSDDDDEDSKFKDLKSQYENSLEELARAHNTIDSLRFGIKKEEVFKSELKIMLSQKPKEDKDVIYKLKTKFQMKTCLINK